MMTFYLCVGVSHIIIQLFLYNAVWLSRSWWPSICVWASHTSSSNCSFITPSGCPGHDDFLSVYGRLTHHHPTVPSQRGLVVQVMMTFYLCVGVSHIIIQLFLHNAVWLSRSWWPSICVWASHTSSSNCSFTTRSGCPGHDDLLSVCGRLTHHHPTVPS